MIDVGKCTEEEIDSVIVEEEEKLEVILKESKQEFVNCVPTEAVSGSVSFYDKLHWTVKSQVDNIKKTVKDASVDDSKIIEKINVDVVKTEFKKTTEIELVKAKVDIKKEEKKHAEIVVTKEELSGNLIFFY